MFKVLNLVISFRTYNAFKPSFLLFQSYTQLRRRQYVSVQFPVQVDKKDLATSLLCYFYSSWCLLCLFESTNTWEHFFLVRRIFKKTQYSALIIYNSGFLFRLSIKTWYMKTWVNFLNSLHSYFLLFVVYFRSPNESPQMK